MSDIVKARQAVAARFPQEYHVNAIMRGEWDNGALVRDELAKLRANSTGAMSGVGEGERR